MADPSSNTVALTGNALIDGLTQGSEWTNLGAGPIPVITYSLNINNSGLDNANPTPDLQGGTWDATWIATAAAAFQAWENVANIDFQQQAINNNEYYFQSAADLALTRTGDDLFQGSFDLPTGPIVALGIAPDRFLVDTLPGFDHASPPLVWPNPEGDIAFDNILEGFEDQYLVAGGWGFHTFIHEIGHALGLKHSFDDGGNGRPTFTDLGIGAFEDPL